jgi:hypothetical protein
MAALSFPAASPLDTRRQGEYNTFVFLVYLVSLEIQ